MKITYIKSHVRIRRSINFDMDGTIADLYGVKDWLPLLRSENPTPYRVAIPMCDMTALNEVCELLRADGWEINIITWLSKNSSEEYKDAVREAKRNWLKKQGFHYDHFHGVQYGATKADSVRDRYDFSILIDDNKKVRDGWHIGSTIDPTAENLIEALKKILEKGA